jgi:hypothetical protein
MIDAASVLLEVVDAVAQVGAPVVLTSYVDTFNAATGKTTRTATQQTVMASPLYASSKTLAQDTREPASAQLLMPASGLTTPPRNGSKIAVASRVFTVQQVTTHTVGATILAYELSLSEGAP